MSAGLDKLSDDLLARAEAFADKVEDLSRATERKLGTSFLRAVLRAGVVIPTRVRTAYAEMCLHARYGWESDNFAALDENRKIVEDRYYSLVEASMGTPYRSLEVVGRRVVDVLTKRYSAVCDAPTEVVVMRQVSENAEVEIDENGCVTFGVGIRIDNPFGPLAPDLHNLKVMMNGRNVSSMKVIVCGAERTIEISERVTKENWIRGRIGCRFEISFDAFRHQAQECLMEIPLSCKMTEDQMRLFGESEAEGDRFVGRDNELEAVRIKFSGGKGNEGFFVTGQRRSGKSSFLKQVGNIFGTSDVKYIRLSLYGDNRRNDNGTERSPVRRIFGPICSAMGFAEADLKSDGALFSNVITKMQSDRRAYIIAIDEYQNLYDRYWDADEAYRKEVDGVAEKLRWLMTEGCCHLLIAAQDYISEYRKLMNVFAPLHPLRMTYFEEEEIDRLVSKMDPKNVQGCRRLDDASIKWLYSFTGGHPYFAQKICAYLVRRFYDGKEHRIDVSECPEIEWKFLNPEGVNDPVLRSEDFESFYELRLFDRDASGAKTLFDESLLHEFYFAIAKSESTPWFNRRESWIEELKNRGMIQTTQDGLTLRAKVFSKWLAVRSIEDFPVEKFIVGD